MSSPRAPGSPCAVAERTQLRPPQRIAYAVLALALVALGLRFWALGFTPRILPVLIVLGGVWLGYEAVRPRRSTRYEVSRLWICREGDCRKLSELGVARLDWHRPSVWDGWRPALLLQLGRESWPLELGLEGWHDVWDCLRELRPDLGLPDWRRHQGVLKLLVHHRRRGVRLPPGVEVHEPNLIAMAFLSGITVSLMHNFVVPALGLSGSSWEMMIDSASLVLATWTYSRLDPPKLEYVPSPPGTARTPRT
ncbi:hypothetical protein [Oceanithermus desulfurans]|uniref:Uncharacterized protein n=2 Tax=Oceanithermus desulfurans TaxID=227924 RepID=A0A511RHP2_9DEIN|nr:hypothetical protein [Oceanithermus desulfurans]MBB6029188.1 hypothetical protein [Oceanithermus desulfurans]GEM89174.1 hypothetical protein ODE01S_06080 [Oceanithermus desulfurans NBRC 100063]